MTNDRHDDRAHTNDAIPPVDLEASLEQLADLGRVWAKHGLDLGSRALKTSAHTLRVTAEALAALSDTLNDQVDSAAPAPPAVPDAR